MGAAQLISLIALIGPTVQVGEQLFNQLKNWIAQARAEGAITEEEQQMLWDKLESYKKIAEAGNYPAHWQQQPEN